MRLRCHPARRTWAPPRREVRASWRGRGGTRRYISRCILISEQRTGASLSSAMDRTTDKEYIKWPADCVRFLAAQKRTPPNTGSILMPLPRSIGCLGAGPQPPAHQHVILFRQGSTVSDRPEAAHQTPQEGRTLGESRPILSGKRIDLTTKMKCSHSGPVPDRFQCFLRKETNMLAGLKCPIPPVSTW